MTEANTQVELFREGDVATLRIRSSSGINVLSSPVLGALDTLVQRLKDDRTVRFVVVRGDGRTFVAGADISEMSAYDESLGGRLSRLGHSVFDAIERLPQATFAAINGHALGGGCELALACDFRIGVETAKLGQPETRLGLIPGWGGTQRLPRVVGPAVARRLLFGGESISAQESLRIGLVDEVVPATGLDAALQAWFERLRPGGPSAISAIKRALLTGDEPAEFARCFSHSEARDGMRAFLEKKPAPWTQRA